jgi:hypothetical protein
VQLIDGNRGELTVTVDGQVVAQKKGDALPATDEVLAAVRRAAPARANA